MIEIYFDVETRQFATAETEVDESKARRKKNLKRAAAIAAGVAGAGALAYGGYKLSTGKKGVSNISAREKQDAQSSGKNYDFQSSVDKLTAHMKTKAAKSQEDSRKASLKAYVKKHGSSEGFKEYWENKVKSRENKDYGKNAAAIVRSARDKKEQLGHGKGFTARPSNWMELYKKEAYGIDPKTGQRKVRMTTKEFREKHGWYSEN